jgi:hypothetical protein
MKIAQSAAELTATNASCELLAPPGVLVVNTGRTSVSVEITISAASPAQPLDAEGLLTVCKTAGQNAYPHDTVADDHAA